MELNNLVSKYKIQARVYPGILAALPILFIAALLFPAALSASVTSVLISGGVSFFIANIVRSRGLRTERKLLAKWGGFPTTAALRHSSSSEHVDFVRRRTKIASIYGEPLPDVDEEALDPEAADRVYNAAIRALIVRVDSVRDQFPRVEDENIVYGFRRNLLGVKVYGIFIAIIGVMIDVIIFWRSNLSNALILIVILHVVQLASWWLIVRETWVKESADKYAERLFEALDALSIPAE
jgi:hypothetical protein